MNVASSMDDDYDLNNAQKKVIIDNLITPRAIAVAPLDG